jgi:hypothetical protein
MIKQGGNTEALSFFNVYELMAEKDLSLRYSTRAAEYYRNRIAAQANEQEFTELLPDYENGRILMDGRSLKEAHEA